MLYVTELNAYQIPIQTVYTFPGTWTSFSFEIFKVQLDEITASMMSFLLFSLLSTTLDNFESSLIISNLELSSSSDPSETSVSFWFGSGLTNKLFHQLEKAPLAWEIAPPENHLYE